MIDVWFFRRTDREPHRFWESWRDWTKRDLYTWKVILGDTRSHIGPLTFFLSKVSVNVARDFITTLERLLFYEGYIHLIILA